MGKLKFEARTLDEDIVRDGLCAVAALDNSSVSRQMAFLVGGIATQSYLPSSCRRPTSDMDLAVRRSLTYSEFRNFAKEAVTWLQDNGYSTAVAKGHNAYNLTFYDPDTHQASVIEFARRNAQNFGRIQTRLTREYQNARNKVVEERDARYTVSSPEDIVVPKILRGIGSLKRHPAFFYLLSSGEAFPITSGDVEKNLQKIRALRGEAVIHIGDPDLCERLRFESDLYDVRLLAEVIGFNPDYLAESMRDWGMLGERSDENRKLVGYLFPNFKIG